MDKIKWTTLGLLKDKIWLELNKEPGVYRIRHKKKTIQRGKGIDREGVLHIGKSVNLFRRVREFYKGAKGKKSPHKAGTEYYEYNFSKMFPIDSLICDYKYTQTDKDARKLEIKLQREYRQKYLDHPPLDGQI